MIPLHYYSYIIHPLLSHIHTSLSSLTHIDLLPLLLCHGLTLRTIHPVPDPFLPQLNFLHSCSPPGSSWCSWQGHQPWPGSHMMASVHLHGYLLLPHLTAVYRREAVTDGEAALTPARRRRPPNPVERLEPASPPRRVPMLAPSPGRPAFPRVFHGRPPRRGRSVGSPCHGDCRRPACRDHDCRFPVGVAASTVTAVPADTTVVILQHFSSVGASTANISRRLLDIPQL